MSDLRDKATDKIDDVADVAKSTAWNVAASSKDVAHRVRAKSWKKGDKRLQDA